LGASVSSRDSAMGNDTHQYNITATKMPQTPKSAASISPANTATTAILAGNEIAPFVDAPACGLALGGLASCSISSMKLCGNQPIINNPIATANPTVPPTASPNPLPTTCCTGRSINGSRNHAAAGSTSRAIAA